MNIISIHALVKRATHWIRCETVFKDISIHALVKRATSDLCSVRAQQSNFNPRPREEGDLALLKDVLFVNDFNPRPREEGDIVLIRTKCVSSNFNPRPREEGDSKFIQ